MIRPHLLVAALAATSIALGAGAPPATPDPGTLPAGRERTRALAASVTVRVGQALEAAVRETGGTPTTVLLRRRDEGPVYEIRLIVGDGERSVEIDALGSKPPRMREALMTERRQRTIAELRPLLQVAKVDLGKAIAAALGAVPGSRFLGAESEVEDSSLRFAVTLVGDEGLTKVEVDAATGAAGPPVSETPRPVDDPNLRRFDHDRPGSLPAGWKVGATRPHGPPATWQVVADESAPSPPNVLALVSTNHTSADTFNLCWLEQPIVRNGRLEARFKALLGEEDQGGGLAWKVKDADNYYLCRYNPLEENFRVYVVKDGSRRQLAGVKVAAAPHEWHTIAARFVGDRIECLLDGRPLLEARDSTFAGGGGVGVWTKADAVTRFDDLRIEPLPDDTLPVEAPPAQPPST